MSKILYNLCKLYKMDLTLLALAQEQEQTMDYSRCFNCGGSDFIEIDYERICEECQAIDPRYAVFTTENPCYKRQNYSCMDNFKKSIQCYQGLQKCHIPDSIYDALKDTEITRANILKCLKELRYRKLYKDAHYIYYDLTGKLIDDMDTWSISSLKITGSLLWHIENYSLIEKLSKCAVCSISVT